MQTTPRRVLIWMFSTVLIFMSGVAWADGIVLPPFVRPYGYSLDDLARATAAYNEYVTLPAGYVPEQPEPRIPFKMLHTGTGNEFRVKVGTFLYVPLLWGDDSPPIAGDFPSNVRDRRAVQHYLFSPEQNGIYLAQLIIDGEVHPIGPNYASGVTLRLPTGGTRYITLAAVIAPLSPGWHTVEFLWKAKGVLFPDGYVSGAQYQVLVTWRR